MDNSEKYVPLNQSQITEANTNSLKTLVKIQKSWIKDLQSENEILKRTIMDKKIPDEGKKVYRLRKQITQLEDEIAMLREQNATLQRWHKEDMDNLKDDFHHEREELEKKVRDAEYNYNHLTYETDVLRQAGCIQTKYINELEKRDKTILSSHEHGEYKDAMNELYKM